MSADLDREIDRAVRWLLDREPSASLRVRVLASTDARRRRRPVRSSVIPAVAVAALIVLALIMAPWHTTNRPPQELVGRDVFLPLQAAQVAAAAEGAEVASRQVLSVTRAAARTPRRIAIAVATNLESPDAGLDALAGPAPLSVATLATSPAAPLPSIQPAPLRVNALDLPALEMPSDAARGADR